MRDGPLVDQADESVEGAPSHLIRVLPRLPPRGGKGEDGAGSQEPELKELLDVGGNLGGGAAEIGKDHVVGGATGADDVGGNLVGPAPEAHGEVWPFLPHHRHGGGVVVWDVHVAGLEAALLDQHPRRVELGVVEDNRAELPRILMGPQEELVYDQLLDGLVLPLLDLSVPLAPLLLSVAVAPLLDPTIRAPLRDMAVASMVGGPRVGHCSCRASPSSRGRGITGGRWLFGSGRRLDSLAPPPYHHGQASADSSPPPGVDDDAAPRLRQLPAGGGLHDDAAANPR